MMKEVVSTKHAPEAIGPYSQAIKVGNMVFLSGQIPTDPKTGDFVSEDITEQTRQALRNLNAVLEASGAKLDDVVKTTVFLVDMYDFAAMNEVYADFFGMNKPARATVEVSKLPRNAKVEIECIAIIE